MSLRRQTVTSLASNSSEIIDLSRGAVQCVAIKTAVAFFERAAKSTVIAGISLYQSPNCHRTVTICHIKACRHSGFFSLSTTPMSQQLSLYFYLSFWFAVFNFCEPYVLTDIHLDLCSSHTSEICFDQERSVFQCLCSVAE